MLGVVLALLSFIAPGCIFFLPVDDALEPNDTTDEATVLPFDAYVQGRAVEDNPDVFKMTLKAGESVNIDLRWLNEGSTDRNTLELMASDGKRLFEGSFGRYVNYCSETASTQEVEALETIKGNCRLRVTPQAPGTYYYTIQEIGDKRFSYHSDWNYELSLSSTLHKIQRVVGLEMSDACCSTDPPGGVIAIVCPQNPSWRQELFDTSLLGARSD